jgi:tetratricopeptide (TPR) repeat protein
VNALVEMGDLDAARRSLQSLTGTNQASDIDKVRIVLLHLRIGDLGAAKELLNEFSHLGKSILKPLLDMAEGRYDDAVVGWRSLLEKDDIKDNEAMVSQNLAVCLLYTGQLNESRALLESLVSANYSFQSLTFNLSTIYELCSDKSTVMKARLAEEVSKQSHFGETNLDRPNTDFKL